MASKISLIAVAALAGARYVSAQAAPNWQYVPTSCASQCSVTVQVAYLCESQFTSTTDIYGCWCNSFPSDASTCASCLNSNNAAALGQLVSSTITACPQAKQSCFFECSFNTCNNNDIPCQCSASYLENIYNCASCNSANGNTQATVLSNFQALQASCEAQSYAGANSSFTTQPLASATGFANYQPPTLTAAGGGAAATGGTALTAGVAPTTISGAQGTTMTTGTGATTAAGGSSGGSSGSAAGGASGGAMTGSAAGSSSTGKSSANGLVAPAFGGLLAAAGAVVAFL